MPPRSHYRPTVLALAIWLLPAIAATALAQTPSTVSINATPNPASYGQAVTIQATVTTGATGRVTFYDSTTVLGIATISAGQANLTTTSLSTGVRSLRAYYAGDSTYAPSTSSNFAETVTSGASLGFRHPVTYATGTSSGGVATGDFNGDGKRDLAVTNYNAVVVLLGNGDGTFQAAVSYTAGSGTVGVATGDFNGDGKLDLVVTNQTGANISILLGRGDGTFQAATNYTVGSYPQSVTTGDFNRDGIVDLAVANYYGSNVSVLLGNGDGTFHAAVNYSANNYVSNVTTGDLNGDGKTDLITAGSAGVALFLGNGDGTFHTATVLNSNSANSAFVGDFNGDGRSDVAAVSSNAGTLTILLGNGDGTVHSGTTYTVSTYSFSLVGGDFNGDNTLDLALTNNYYYATNNVQVFMGNGDGTFAGPTSYSVAQNAGGFAVGDFNGDGIADLAVDSFIPNTNSAGVAVMLGGAIPDPAVAISHGNGFTQAQVGASYTVAVNNAGDITTTGAVGVVISIPSGFVATAISGTGWTCTLGTLTCTRSDTLAAGATYPPIKVVVNVPSALTGNVTASATISGGGDQNAANNTASDTSFVRLLPPMSLSATPNPSTIQQGLTLNATVSAAATGKVTFYDNTAILGTAPVSAGKASFVTYALPDGVRSLRAIYGGDSTYGPATATTTATVTQISSNGVQSTATYRVAGVGQVINSADLNHDGKTDIVTLSGSSSTVIVLLGNGNGTFANPVSYTVTGASSPNAIVIGDVNQDGNPDLIVSDYYGIYILLGNGDGTFQASSKITAATQGLSSLTATDFNGDGKLDLVGLYSGSPTVLLGNGDGTFQPGAPVTTGGSSWSYLLVADFNGDGKPDLAGLNTNYNGYVSVLLGVGDGTFQAPVNYSDPSMTYSNTFVAGDFDGDGKQDIAVIYWSSVTVIAGNGDGTFRKLASSTLPGATGYQVMAGDFNGDGMLDIAVSTYSSGFVLALGNGDGTFRTGPQLDSSGGVAGFVFGDFNGDGRVDLAASDSSNQNINIFTGRQYSGMSVMLSHNGNFTGGTSGTYQILAGNPGFLASSGTVVVTATLPGGLTATALSGYGWTCTLASLTCSRSDALAGAATYSPISLTVNISSGAAPATVTTRASVTNGGIVNSATDSTNLVVPTTLSLTVSPGSSALGQVVALTGTVTSGASGTVEFFENDVFVGSALVSGSQAVLNTRLLPAGALALTAAYGGDSTHASSLSTVVAHSVTATQTSGLSTASAYATGASPKGIATGDWNADGKPDLVTANSTANTISVLLGNGDGTFGSKVDYTVGTNPNSVAFGDFNNDGKPDLAVANQGSNSVSILLGNGDGTFQSAVNYVASTAAGVTPYSVAVGDVNNDGKTDLVLASNYGSQILLGNGDGTFTPPVSTGYNSTLVALGDFNKDGKPDIALSNGNIYVFAGVGDGTFSSLYYWGSGGNGFAVGDLNGDGNLDIVQADYSSGVTVSLGRGDGTYLSATHYAGGASGQAVAIADVNGDGKLDVVTVNNSNNNISVLLGNGDGTLQAAVLYNVGSQPSAIVAGDFNNDGRTDLAIANSQSNNVTIYLGILTPVLSITSSHVAAFAPGQTGATYQLNVTNNGPGATSGAITVTDTLPSGLTATAISGTGWTCTLATASCTRSDSLAAGLSYPTVLLTVNVSPSAPVTVTNSAAVSGGGAIGASTSDFTVITSTPAVLSVSKTHSGNFGSGQSGAVYTVTVSNSASAGASIGPVSVTEAIPTGLTLVSMSGTGWNCSSIVCSRSDALAAGASYPPITVTVNVAANAPLQVNNQVTVSGGGSVSASAMDATTVAAPPVNVSVTPASGTGATQAFNASFSDIAGYQDIRQVQFMVDANLNPVSSCFARWDRGVGFYLLNDSATVWLGPLAPGASSTLQNSQCLLNGSTSAVTGTGNTLNVSFGLTFLSGMSGAQNVYLLAVGSVGNSPWQAKGAWTSVPALAPVNVSVSPSSGSGTTQAFTASFSDASGYQDIHEVQFMVNSTLTAASSCFLRWDSGIGYYLLNDSASSWLGPLAPGASGTLQNSQCVLNGATSAVSGSGNTLSVTFGLNFLSGMAGQQNLYMLAVGSAGNSPWTAKGTWTGSVVPQPPVIGSVTPSSGTGQTQAFTASFSDVSGYQDIQQVQFLINSTLSAPSSCFVRWDRGIGYYLLNDAATGWTGPLVPGGSGTLQNSQCILTGTSSTVNGSGNTLNITFGISFQSGMAGAENVYTLAVGSAGNSGWAGKASWTAGAAAQPPVNVSVTPSSGSGSSQAFTATFSDAAGYTDIRQVQFMVNSSLSPASSCFVRWDRGVGYYLLNDGATGWMGPLAPAASGTLQNSQCTLSGATSAVSGTGNTLTVTFALTFSSGVTGTQNIYMLAVGSTGNSPFAAKGTWIAGVAAQAPVNLSVTPSAASAVSQTFTASFSDASGYQDIQQVQFLVNTSLNPVSACFVRWDRGVGFYLLNDAATQWSGPLAAGASGTLQNSRCSLSGTTSVVSGSGNTLNVTFSLSLQSGVTGSQNVYVLAVGSAGISPWQALSAWTIPVTAQPPANVSVTPSSGAGLTQTFTASFSDASGYSDIQQVQFMVASSLNPVSACFVRWDRGVGYYLLNDAATGWIGPLTSTLQNSQCTLNGSTTSVSGTGNTLNVSFGLTFPHATSTQNLYMLAVGSGGNSSWRAKGTWIP